MAVSFNIFTGYNDSSDGIPFSVIMSEEVANILLLEDLRDVIPAH